MDAVELLKRNIEHEKILLQEIRALAQKQSGVSEKNRMTINKTLNSLFRQLEILNNSLPALLGKIGIAQELPVKPEIKRTGKAIKAEKTRAKEKDISTFTYNHLTTDGKRRAQVAISKEHKKSFLSELSNFSSFFSKLKKGKIFSEGIDEEQTETKEIYRKTNPYVVLSSKFFSSFSLSLAQKPVFKKIEEDIKKANLQILLPSYISIMLFSTLISFIAAIFLSLLIFFMSGNPLSFLIIVLLPAVIFTFFFFYPNLEKKSSGKKIDQELPFVVIHMAAIAGSGIAPIEIFKIIAISKEYKQVSKEMKKLVNQINLYGYDLTTALRNNTKLTSSKKLAELYNGLATTISSGGNLKNFFEKRAESLMLDYRLERKRFSAVAETMMDIYISILIAAPLILVMLLIIMNTTGINLGISMQSLSISVIALIGILNVLFLVFLSIKQPS